MSAPASIASHISLSQPGSLDDALLREGDDLDVDDVLILLPQRHDALEGTQAADRVHVDMGADREGAVFDRLEHHVLRTVTMSSTV